MEEKIIKIRENEASSQSVSGDNTSSIIDLINLMLSVNVDSDEAKLNETSISDGNGGRILL